MTLQQGKKFIFISYAHKDAKVVLPLIEGLIARNFNVWYDDSIEAGSEWPEYIATNLLASECVIVFMSRNADASHNCRQELTYAINKRKRIIVTYLENFHPTPGTEMQLHNLHALYLFHYPTSDAFLDHLSMEHKLQSCISDSKYLFSSTPTSGGTYNDLSNAIHYDSYSNQSPLLLPIEEISSSNLSNKPANPSSSDPLRKLARPSLILRISNHLFCPITCLLHLSYIYIGSQFTLPALNFGTNTFTSFVILLLFLLPHLLITFTVTGLYHLFRKIIPANTRAKSFRYNKICFHISTLGAIIYSYFLNLGLNTGAGFDPTIFFLCSMFHFTASLLPAFFLHILPNS